MPTITLERAEQIVAGWRSDTGAIDGYDNPAGALYASGEYALADLIMSGPNTRCGTICTASTSVVCC